MTTQTETLKLALEAIKNSHEYRIGNPAYEQVEAKIEESLVQPEQEPENRCVRELREFAKSNQGAYIFPSWDGHRVLKYLGDTTPPQRKPLTDEQIDVVMPQPTEFGKVQPPWSGSDITILRAMARAIEAAHGIKE